MTTIEMQRFERTASLSVHERERERRRERECEIMTHLILQVLIWLILILFHSTPFFSIHLLTFSSNFLPLHSFLLPFCPSSFPEIRFNSRRKQFRATFDVLKTRTGCIIRNSIQGLGSAGDESTITGRKKDSRREESPLEEKWFF